MQTLIHCYHRYIQSVLVHVVFVHCKQYLAWLVVSPKHFINQPHTDLLTHLGEVLTHLVYGWRQQWVETFVGRVCVGERREMRREGVERREGEGWRERESVCQIHKQYKHVHTTLAV